jgi:pimeloyl-ACP methyl ester carboxylesterase
MRKNIASKMRPSTMVRTVAERSFSRRVFSHCQEERAMPKIKTRDGTEIYVKVQGSGQPVVLIHGWPLQADSFDDQALALADAGFMAVSYDRRGFGRSDQPAGGYDYDTFSDDLADVIAALNLSNIVLCGFSMGGGEIARYMSRHNGQGIAGQGVARAIFISSVGPYLLQTDDNPNGAPEAALEDMKANIREDRAAFFDDFFEQFYGVGFVSSPVSDGVLRWSWAMAMQAGLNATLRCVDAFGRTDFRGDVASIKVPTLIIHGTDDKTVPIDATGRALARTLPDARLVEIEGGAHGIAASHKSEVNTALLSFLGAEASYVERVAQVRAGE